MNTIVPGSGSSLRLADIAPGMRGAIAVYAASATDIDPVYYEAARELGALIAREGYALVDGGGAVGLMGAVNDGCLRAGGTAIGVIPAFMHERGWGHTGLSAQVVAADMHHRKSLMAALADGVIALPGGAGTLEEILEIITWRKLRLFDGPAVIADIAGFYRPLAEMLTQAVNQGFMSDTPPLYAIAPTPAEALSLALGRPLRPHHSDL